LAHGVLANLAVVLQFPGVDALHLRIIPASGDAIVATRRALQGSLEYLREKPLRRRPQACRQRAGDAEDAELAGDDRVWS
jgi:hypothetical protein